jgi:coenzyme F420 hydrogenase subunit beta
MESYAYDSFLYLLFAQKGIDPATVTKFSIKRGKFKIFVNNEEKLSLPLKEIRYLVNSGCMICSDYSGESADISVGAIGSPIGWSTVFVRTARGEELLKGSVKAGFLEMSPLKEEGPEFDLLLREADRKKQRAAKNLT